MKNRIIFYKLLSFILFVFAFIGCASAPQKAAINNASGFDPYFDYDSEIEELDNYINDELCYLIYGPSIFITGIKDVNSRRLNYSPQIIGYNGYISGVPEGTHTLNGRVSGANITQSSTVSLTFTVEIGKYYELYMESKRISSGYNTATFSFEFFIRELTDPERINYAKNMAARYRTFNEKSRIKNIEARQKKEAFMPYSEFNSSPLAGQWIQKKGAKLRFEENNIRFSTAKNSYSGTYAFNENTIIMLWKDASGRNNGIKKDIWNYTLEDDVLNILNGSKRPLAKIKGEYSLDQSSNLNSSINSASESVESRINNLDGTWYYRHRYPWYNNTIIFESDRFTIKSYNRVAKRELVTSGNLLYDDEKIILSYRSRNNKDISVSETLYYNLDDNILHIYKAPNSVAIATLGSLKGKYNIISLQENNVIPPHISKNSTIPEGSWRKNKNTVLSFTDKKLKLTIKKDYYEGSYSFDENILTIQWEVIYSSILKKESPIQGESHVTWYCDLNNSNLNIIKTVSRNGWSLRNIKGKYKRE